MAHGIWETPIMTPVKLNGSVRICAKYRCTINKALPDHAYPVPIVSHVLATSAGAKIFGKEDLAQAYQQLPVDAAFVEAQTIVTHRGAFRVTRLQFAVSIVPGIFQNLMDSLFKEWGHPILRRCVHCHPDLRCFCDTPPLGTIEIPHIRVKGETREVPHWGALG